MMKVAATFLAAILNVGYLAGANDGIALSHQARALQPGEVLVLEARAADGKRLESVEGKAFGKDIRFFSDDRRIWRALVGIDLSVEPGAHEATVKARLEGEGETLVESYPLRVEGKEFPTRHLTVDGKYVDPPKETQNRIWRESRKLKRIFSTVTGERIWEGPFRRPVPGRVNPDSFGKRSIFNGKPRSPHSGADFSAPEGTPVKAPNYGRVVLAENLYFAGNTVILDHGLGLYTYFAHLSEFKVEEGETVTPGDVLGLSGATGRVTGPHLHYSVRLLEAKVDPLSLMEVTESVAGKR